MKTILTMLLLVATTFTTMAQNKIYDFIVTDNKGNVSTIDECRHVRMALNLVNRGCSSFVVGKAGQTVRPYGLTLIKVSY